MNFIAFGTVVLAAVISSPMSRAAYSTGFEDERKYLSVYPRWQDGWSINDSTPNLSNFASLNGSFAGGIGALFSSPSVLNVDLIHSYSAPVAGTKFDVDFDIEQSSVSFPNRDSFGWSFKSGASDLFRVAFEPGAAGRLEVAWYDSSNVRHTITPASQDIFYGGLYHLEAVFSAAGADALFTATLTGANPFSWSGTLTGAGSANLSAFGADFDVSGATGDQAGDNFMLFDNLSITTVPEPSGALLSGVFAAGLLLRRRR